MGKGWAAFFLYVGVGGHTICGRSLRVGVAFYTLSCVEVFIMAAIRSIERIAKKWATVTPGRTGYYQAGVEAPRRDWETATAAAEDAYQSGVTQAIAEKRFGKGVRAAGSEKWQRNAIEKGGQRWGPGVAMAEAAYAAGFAPFRDAIERVTLPPRFARRDPRNLNRVKAVVDALIAASKRTGA